MLEEITSLYDLDVYTDRGVYVGPVNNVTFNLETCEIESLIIEETNENLVEGGRPISVPFRWVHNVGDIVLLRNFPNRVNMTDEERAAWEHS